MTKVSIICFVHWFGGNLIGLNCRHLGLLYVEQKRRLVAGPLFCRSSIPLHNPKRLFPYVTTSINQKLLYCHAGIKWMDVSEWLQIGCFRSHASSKRLLRLSILRHSSFFCRFAGLKEWRKTTKVPTPATSNQCHLGSTAITSPLKVLCYVHITPSGN